MANTQLGADLYREYRENGGTWTRRAFYASLEAQGWTRIRTIRGVELIAPGGALKVDSASLRWDLDL